jgi:hypothetical protein
MRIRRLLFLAAGLVFAAGGTAGAQDSGKAGVTIAYPGSIGLIWHVTDAVAIRPDFVFSHTSTGGGSSGAGTGFGTDISALFYLKKYDNVRTYVSPRFSYTRSSSTIDTGATAQGFPNELESTSTSTGGAGLFGVQYSAGSHFTIFGEAGIGFSHRKSESSFSGSGPAIKSNAWGTTAGIGIVFYP